LRTGWSCSIGAAGWRRRTMEPLRGEVQDYNASRRPFRAFAAKLEDGETRRPGRHVRARRRSDLDLWVAGSDAAGVHQVSVASALGGASASSSCSDSTATSLPQCRFLAPAPASTAARSRHCRAVRRRVRVHDGIDPISGAALPGRGRGRRAERGHRRRSAPGCRPRSTTAATPRTTATVRQLLERCLDVLTIEDTTRVGLRAAAAAHRAAPRRPCYGNGTSRSRSLARPRTPSELPRHLWSCTCPRGRTCWPDKRRPEPPRWVGRLWDGPLAASCHPCPPVPGPAGTASVSAPPTGRRARIRPWWRGARPGAGRSAACRWARRRRGRGGPERRRRSAARCP
jgi:hypothetical protein